ncbi:6-pyruvoyl-tetrahydropterin synthase-related protein [Rhizomicrobium electricum]|uniref:Membrane protein 6-pyruvoyl-tetrahydropterin synthase-related domain-containing protein n=1 Tax=Rhizomicrobium electricum TaxID=480070 RepID=A0ABP3QBC1_9PROT|nr:6-pyruvoyl-tetrahydropterin synthase-related protein [Rhizomicrobium electricum]NIJ50770.1 hypothetical protein [Rhizomicrobium electricum]
MTKPTPRYALIAVTALTGLLCAVGLWRVLTVLPLQFPFDPNEGWNAYHTAALMSGHALYPGPEAYLVNNYPPLSFYVVGLVGLLVGDNIIAGRIVSLLAVAAIGVAMTVFARRQGASRNIAVLPALWFVAGLLVTTDYVGMDDPQLLAHAVSLAGLIVLMRTSRHAVAAAAALFVAAFFVKHAVVALPAASFLWLLIEDRRRAFQLAGYGLGFLVAGLLAFRLGYGVSLFAVVATARGYSLDQLTAALLHWLSWTAPAIVALALLAWFVRESAVRFVALYAAVAIVIGSYFLGGAGVDPNVMFDADIALGLGLALAVHKLDGWKRPLAAAIAVAPLFVIVATDKDWQAAYLDRPVVKAEAFIAHGDIAFMAAQKGLGLCEMLAFCYWAGKPVAVDMFNVGQAFETGARSDAEVARAVQAKRYAVIQFDPGEPYALGENVYQALMQSYRLHHSDDFGTFYVPK